MTDFPGPRLLAGDGAMGTMLHAAGCALDRALPEVSLSDPGLVGTIHDSYLAAGADVIQTNTFGANRLWLAGHGCADQVGEINQAAVRIARAARDRACGPGYVAGSVSPAVTARLRRQVGAAERAEVLAEQVRVLATAGADLIILETFGYLDELAEAVTVASAACTLAAGRAGHVRRGRPGRWAARRRVRSPPYSASCRWSCSARTARPARSGCWPWSRTWSPAAPPVTRSPTPGSRAGSATGISSSAWTAATSPGTCAGSPRPARRWSAGAAGLPRPTSRPRWRSRPGCAPRHPGRPPGSASKQPWRPPGPPPGAGTGPAGLAARLARGDFVIAAEITVPDDGVASRTTDTVLALREQGVDLVAVTAPGASAGAPGRSRPGAAPAAAHRSRGHGDDDHLGQDHHDPAGRPARRACARYPRRHLRGLAEPPVLGDYPAVDGIWEVDPAGLVTLLASLNAWPRPGRAAAGQEDLVLHRDPGQTRPPGTWPRRPPGPRPRSGPGAVPGHPAGVRTPRAARHGRVTGRHWRSANDVGSPAGQLRGSGLPGARGAGRARPGRRAGRHATGLPVGPGDRPAVAAGLLRAARPLVSGVLLAGAGPDVATLRPLLAAAGRA